MQLQCTNCGHEIVSGAEFCGNCGAKLVTNNPVAAQPQPTAVPTAQIPNATEIPSVAVPAVQPAAQAVASAPPVPITLNQAPGSPPAQMTGYAQPPGSAYAVLAPKSSGMSIASMVLGIISLLLCWIFFISIPLGILALIFALIGRKKGGKGMAIAGLITGVLGVVLSIAIIGLAINSASNKCKSNPSDAKCTQKASSLLDYKFSTER